MITRNQNMGKKGKSCYIDINIFIADITTKEIYLDVAKDVETRFNTSNYELERLLPRGENRKVIELMK